MNNYFPYMYKLGSSSSGSYNLLEEVLNISTEGWHMEGSNYTTTVSLADAKIAASNKSHSEAERRRRKRINGHLSTLRGLVSNSIKGDKASLLAEVVRRIKELKNTTGDHELVTAAIDDAPNEVYSKYNNLTIPTETDELKLCYTEQDSGIMKASVCCDDRPEILADLKRALTSVEAKALRAEMATVGGRTKIVLWLQVNTGNDGEENLEKLRKALKIVIDKSFLLPGPGGVGQSMPGCKRPCLYHC